MKLLRLDCCFIVTLVPWASIRHLCPVLYCFQTIMGSQKLVVRTYGQHQSSVQWKSQPKSSWKAFLSMPSVIPWQRKVGKMHQLCNRTLFYPSSLIFAIHTLIISPQHIKLALVCSAEVSEHSVLTNVMKDPLLIVRVILQRWSVKTLILSGLSR